MLGRSVTVVHQRLVVCFTRAARVTLRASRWRGDGAWRRVPFLDTHSTSVLRNVKAILAVNQVLADSAPVLNVLMVTAVKTAG